MCSYIITFEDLALIIGVTSLFHFPEMVLLEKISVMCEPWGKWTDSAGSLFHL